MADVMIDRRRAVARDRSLAIALSVAAHLLAFLALFWKFGASLAYPETPVMNVELAPWSRTSPAPPPPVKPPKAKPNPIHPNLPPVLTQPLSEARPADAVPQAPVPQTPVDEATRLRNALRRGAGCEHADLLGLSAAERQACQDRQAKAQGGGPRLNFDLRGGYAKNREPFLARTPKNGCAPRLAESDVQAIGQGQQKQNWTASVGCAWSF
jgi:hypothetical protein